MRSPGLGWNSALQPAESSSTCPYSGGLGRPGLSRQLTEVPLNTWATVGQRGRCSPAGVLHGVNGSLALLLPPLHVSLWRVGSCEQGWLLPPSSQFSGMEHPNANHHGRRDPPPPAPIFPPATPAPPQLSFCERMTATLQDLCAGCSLCLAHPSLGSSRGCLLLTTWVTADAAPSSSKSIPDVSVQPQAGSVTMHLPARIPALTPAPTVPAPPSRPEFTRCRPWERSSLGQDTHLMLGQLRQRAAHVLLQPVQGHRRLVGQDVDALSEFVSNWVQDGQLTTWGPWGAGRGLTGDQRDKALDS